MSHASNTSDSTSSLSLWIGVKLSLHERYVLDSVTIRDRPCCGEAGELERSFKHCRRSDSQLLTVSECRIRQVLKNDAEKAIIRSECERCRGGGGRRGSGDQVAQKPRGILRQHCEKALDTDTRSLYYRKEYTDVARLLDDNLGEHIDSVALVLDLGPCFLGTLGAVRAFCAERFKHLDDSCLDSRGSPGRTACVELCTVLEQFHNFLAVVPDTTTIDG